MVLCGSAALFRSCFLSFSLPLPKVVASVSTSILEQVLDDPFESRGKEGRAQPGWEPRSGAAPLLQAEPDPAAGRGSTRCLM